ncbi:MAG: hypothetical protein U9P49_07200, partial [Thermodesulfobacteriota bacterium]|nr:hypothetical protein [Thermodesulfobacteriota bacterium]
PLEVRHVLHKILISLNKWLSIYQGDGFDPIRSAFLARSHIIGAAACTQEGRQCKIIGLNMEGHLLVEASGRIHNLLSGDIHIDL